MAKDKVKRLTPEAFQKAWASGKADREAALEEAWKIENLEERAEAIGKIKAAWATIKADLLAHAPAEG